MGRTVDALSPNNLHDILKWTLVSFEPRPKLTKLGLYYLIYVVILWETDVTLNPGTAKVLQLYETELESLKKNLMQDYGATIPMVNGLINQVEELLEQLTFSLKPLKYGYLPDFSHSENQAVLNTVLRNGLPAPQLQLLACIVEWFGPDLFAFGTKAGNKRPKITTVGLNLELFLSIVSKVIVTATSFLGAETSSAPSGTKLPSSED